VVSAALGITFDADVTVARGTFAGGKRSKGQNGQKKMKILCRRSAGTVLVIVGRLQIYNK
jgi:hypothetical protein